jgi:hypothetical protein
MKTFFKILFTLTITGERYKQGFFLEKEVPELTRGERTNIRKAL